MSPRIPKQLYLTKPSSKWSICYKFDLRTNKLCLKTAQSITSVNEVIKQNRRHGVQMTMIRCLSYPAHQVVGLPALSPVSYHR